MLQKGCSENVLRLFMVCIRLYNLLFLSCLFLVYGLIGILYSFVVMFVNLVFCIYFLILGFGVLWCWSLIDFLSCVDKSVDLVQGFMIYCKVVVV